jgi:hypothetical protein
MSKEEQKIIDYMVICVNEFADRYSVNYKEAFNYLKRYKSINFLLENYEIEHTLSIDDAIEDMAMIARNNGGDLM